VQGEAVWVQRTTVAQQWARDAHRDDSTQALPQEYEQHQRVFNDKQAKCFPLKRKGELEIPLMPEAPKVIDCKVYPLTKEERDLLCTFLSKEQEKGYIYSGSSPYTALVFFIEKNDSDEKHIIMDYRKLNEWTICDNGPLPNIRTQLETLQGKMIFTKMDIQWGYKNHLIKEEDQYKAAFKTVFGTFIPRVVYFNLKSAPPFFQWMMAKEFALLLQKYKPYLSNYLDNWIIATPEGEEGLKLH
jgi:hypothetical protein